MSFYLDLRNQPFLSSSLKMMTFPDYVHSSTNHVSLHNFTTFTYKTKRTLFEQVWTVLTIFHVLGLWKRCLWRAVVSGMWNVEQVIRENRRGGPGTHCVSSWGSPSCPQYVQGDVTGLQANCKPVTFFAMDVECKYWPYLRRVTEKWPELQDLLTMGPFLSVYMPKLTISNVR